MITPRIKKHCSSLNPWQIYQHVDRKNHVAFFLDTPNGGQGFSYIGWNPFATVRLQNGVLEVRENGRRQKFPAVRLWPVLRQLCKKYKLKKIRNGPFFTGGAVGYWGYELVSIFEKVKFRRKKKWAALPDLFLGFYRDLIVYDHRAGCYWLVTYDTWQAFKAMENFFTAKISASEAFHFSQFRPSLGRKQFETMVRRAKDYIAAGDIYQANLSQRFLFNYRGNPCALYEALRKINPSPFASFLKIGTLRIVGSSPERLVRKRGDLCETKPIAGTRPRAAGRDRSLARELFHNEKERAEHLMLVDLERNDLGRVCRWPTVRVKELMAIEKYSHVMHLVSKITGRLRKDCDVFDLIQAMFPGGTITGCPKIRCMEIIDELEPERRGLYTGSIGYIDFQGNADLNIVIRTLVLKLGKGFYQEGAGIVHDSVPRKEYEETLYKGMALKAALERASKFRDGSS